MARFRALVVDDELQVRHTTARALTRIGFECQLACDGKDALSSIENEHFDLVVTDLKMPDVNGHRLATELLSLEERPVVSVLTGVEEPKLAKDLATRGVDRIYYKPVDYLAFASDLLSIVEQRKISSNETEAVDRKDAITSTACPSPQNATLENYDVGCVSQPDALGNTAEESADRIRLRELFNAEPNAGNPLSPNSASPTLNNLKKVESEFDIGLSNTFARTVQSELARTKAALEELRLAIANGQAITYFNLSIAIFSGLLSGVILGCLGSWYFGR